MRMQTGAHIRARTHTHAHTPSNFRVKVAVGLLSIYGDVGNIKALTRTRALNNFQKTKIHK